LEQRGLVDRLGVHQHSVKVKDDRGHGPASVAAGVFGSREGPTRASVYYTCRVPEPSPSAVPEPAANRPSGVIIFDDGLGQIAPLNDLRPSFDIRTGAMTTLARLRLAMGLRVVALYVPEALAALTREQHTEPVNQFPNFRQPDPVLLINGRCVLPIPELDLVSTGKALVEAATGHVIAAKLEQADARAYLETGTLNAARVKHGSFALLSRPWQIRTFRDVAMRVDLDLLGTTNTSEPPRGLMYFGGHRLSIHPSARIYVGVTLDLEHGPIVIDSGAMVRAGAILAGPCYVGPGSTVLEHAFIKAHTAIGPTCKVAGEVGGTIFQGFANKSHEGHLGDSWVGEWANLGAGTTNSNLLNTYGEVLARAAPGGPNERTGETFLGAIIGDHVKTSICTRIMTGAVIHSGAMIAQSAAVNGCVAPFAWCTDEGEKIFRVDKFLEVARTVMGRRKMEPTGAYVDRLTRLHAEAAARGKAAQKP
jgi:UDP-N-acetylglucosamine diphosphorylase/glucosamine-1-phosphate N-acetyltransferase